tara:strand:+ start:145 stop:621 length:477 start_codon:yes stop_codon:yes gene_type:complete
MANRKANKKTKGVLPRFSKILAWYYLIFAILMIIWTVIGLGSIIFALFRDASAIVNLLSFAILLPFLVGIIIVDFLIWKGILHTKKSARIMAIILSSIVCLASALIIIYYLGILSILGQGYAQILPWLSVYALIFFVPNLTILLYFTINKRAKTVFVN